MGWLHLQPSPPATHHQKGTFLVCGGPAPKLNSTAQQLRSSSNRSTDEGGHSQTLPLSTSTPQSLHGFLCQQFPNASASVMFGTSKIVLLCGAALGALVNAQGFVYRFDGQRSAGIDGTVLVEYVGNGPTEAKISAELDFSRLDLDAVRKADGNCTNANITEFKWHIHVKWNSTNTSESFGQCSKNLTGNHYDPLKACGPFSEFADTDECKAKVKSYNCTPARYAKDPAVCEKGDLSGKVGAFKPDAKKKVKTHWVDKNFPTEEENTPEWNIIIHA
ncbi:TPA: hypothetical protein N0F65_007744, partial [Lagenidium giganteum]